MIKTATSPTASGAPSGAAGGGKARPKAKPKKAPDADAADADKQKAKRRSRPPHKKREADDADADGRPSQRPYASPALAHALLSPPDLLASPKRLYEAQTAHLDQMYTCAPRLLPDDLQGIKSLTQSEIQSDLKRIQRSMAAFEARIASVAPASGRDGRAAAADESEDDLAGMPYGSMLRDRRMHRADGVVTPEEIVESVPVARRAVKITERELRALQRERDDLERDFMRLRATYVWQVCEMKRMQKQQDRVVRVLSRDVTRKAKSLESSRRRTSALQDIMTELDARGSAIMRLTREKYQLEALLRKHNVELPEMEEVFIGDRVKCSPFGLGHVVELDDDARIVVVDLDAGGRAYVQEEDVEVLSSEITYLEAEQQLKLKLFEKIGALVQPNGKFSMLGASTRGRGRNVSDGDVDDDMSGSESQSTDDDEEGSSDADGGDKDSDAADDGRRDGGVEHVKKKRKLIMNPGASGGASKKKSKLQKVITFPATTLPITPYDHGLLVSPLSTLPERVAAVGPSALQWLPSYLPSNMHEWEQERYQSLQMKGEIERLRFQLQKAEAEKLDAQQHASDQVESINQLVVQLEKLRESHGAPTSSSSSDAAASTEGSGGDRVCPSCGADSIGISAPRKNSTTSNKSSNGSNGGGRSTNARKETAKRSRDSGGDDEPDSDEAKKSDGIGREEDAPAQDKAGAKSQDEEEDDGGDSSDAASAARTTRSLRPRRKAAAATGSQPK